MKILLSTGVGYLTHTLPEVEKMALDLGYDGVEVVMPPRHRTPAETIRDTSYGALKHALSVHTPGDVYDQLRFRSALDDACGIAAIVGASLVNAHPAAFHYGGRKNILDAIAYIKEKERETGLTIVYEVLVHQNGLLPERHAALLEQLPYEKLEDYLTDVKENDLAACLDTAHLGTWFVEPTTLIEPLGKNLKHVHFGDYHAEKKIEHLVPGTGTLNLTSFLHTLANTHSDITLTVELHPPTTVQTVENNARQSIQFIQNALGA